ncbi:hypothetical protein BAZOLSSOX_960 [uncultured Gammaproteobacteria bacterium]|jgi:hypothetical protein|nr:hypothetical protein BAZOLSSOX_960 [uncultured Gammaproteobacteria bacterium]
MMKENRRHFFHSKTKKPCKPSYFIAPKIKRIALPLFIPMEIVDLFGGKIRYLRALGGLEKEIYRVA